MNRFSLLILISVCICSLFEVTNGQEKQSSPLVTQLRILSQNLHGTNPPPIPDFFPTNKPPTFYSNSGTASITGTAFNDHDSSGSSEYYELRLRNWKIYLTGDTTLETLTDSLGHYSFTGLEVGTYTISQELQAGWVQTVPPPPGIYTLTLTTGQVVTGLNFGNYFDITPFVNPFTYIDSLNYTTTIYWGLHPLATTCLDPFMGEITLPPTPPPGALDFRFVYPSYGSDCLELGTWVDIRKYHSTTQVDTMIMNLMPIGPPFTIRWSKDDVAKRYNGDVTLMYKAADGPYSYLNMKTADSLYVKYVKNYKFKIIANSPVSGSISGIVFNDQNRDSLYNIGDTPLKNWKVYLSGTIADTQTTDENGFYTFTNLPDGFYTVTEEMIDLASQTFPPNKSYSYVIDGMQRFEDQHFGNIIIPELSIREIQFNPQDSLLLANTYQDINTPHWTLQTADRIETSSPYDDTVTIIGLCVIPPKILNSTVAGFNMILYDTAVGNAPWSGIFVRCNPSDSLLHIQDGLLDIKKGDIIKMTGKLSEYPIGSMNSLTQIQPIPGKRIIKLDSNSTIPPPVQLNDSVEYVYQGQLTPSGPYHVQYSTAEQYESMIVELKYLTVQSYSLIGGTTLFEMTNARGSSISAIDLTSNSLSIPNMGAKIKSIKALLIPLGGTLQNRGYILGYIEEDDITLLLEPPIISSHLRNPIVVQEASPYEISVNVERAPLPSYPIDSVFCVMSLNNGPFVKSLMTKNPIGNMFKVTYPGLSANDDVRYFLQAIDSDGESSILAFQDNSGSYSDTSLYKFNFKVLNHPQSIFDIQYSTNVNGASNYIGATVSLQGIVTADSNDLMTTGFTNFDTHAYYLQSGNSPWNGIWLVGAPGDTSLAKLQRGDSISVTGLVSEDNSVTHLDSILNSAIVISSNNFVPEPLQIPITVLSSGSSLAEQYEGMLVTIRSTKITSLNPFFSDQHLFAIGHGTEDVYVGLNGKNTYTNISSDSLLGRNHILSEDDPIQSITGIVYYNVSANRYVICPRTDEDFIAGEEVTYNPRWNLVSISREQTPAGTGFMVNSLFPTAVSQAFSFVGNYSPDSNLKTGVGYWIKFASQTTYRRLGAKLLVDTIPLVRGWNLIGTIGDTITIDNTIVLPFDNFVSEFYKYHHGYYTTSTLIPGMGYWVKANQPGYLILSSVTRNLSSHNKIRIVHSNELPPPPPGGSEYTTDVLPGKYALEQNYPNPFNGSTTIRYQIPEEFATRNLVPVTLTIYNVLGQQIATLVNEVQPAGFMSVTWDASNQPSGIYYYKLQAGNFIETKKLILMK